MSEQMEVAVLGGGCFWCLDAVYRQVRGVTAVACGYAGGHLPQPTHEQVATGGTGHAQVVRLAFDPAIVSYHDVLEVFFTSHDPTTVNRQGNDIGSSYRSAIFPVTPEQEKIARDTIADVDASGLWPGSVATTIEPAGPFWEAEPEHQDYLERYPNGYTCHFPRAGWVLPPRAAHAAI